MPKIDELLADYLEGVSEANRKREARKLRDRLIEASETDKRNIKKMLGTPRTNQQKAMEDIFLTEFYQEPKSDSFASELRNPIKSRSKFQKKIDAELADQRINRRGKMLAELRKKNKIEKELWEKAVKAAKEFEPEEEDLPEGIWGRKKKLLPFIAKLPLSILETASRIIAGDFDMDYDEFMSNVPILSEAEPIGVGGKDEDIRRAIEEPFGSIADLRRISRERIQSELPQTRQEQIDSPYLPATSLEELREMIIKDKELLKAANKNRVD